MLTFHELMSMALLFLNYTHAFAVGLFYLAALVFDLCKMQTSVPLDFKRRRIPVLLMLIITLNYVIELSYVLASHNRSVSQHLMFHVLSVAMVWIALAVSLSRNQSPLRRPYVGAFVVGSVFEVAISITTTLSHATQEYAPLYLTIARAVVSLALTVDGLLLNCVEEHTDEEAESLLEQAGNADTLRQRRLQEGNWIQYLREFTIFMPYLLPIHDRNILRSLAIRIVIAILGRGLNVIIPRQLGIIADKLVSGTMPSKDIAIWIGYLWLDSRAGLSVLDSLAANFMQTSSYQRITGLAFGHIMSLSSDFHSGKDTGEVLKAMNQAESLNNLVNVVFFEILPIAVDFIIAIGYVTRMFDLYAALIIVGASTIYTSLGIVVTPWIQRKNKVYVENGRVLTKKVYQAVSSWQTVILFDRVQYEKDRHSDAVKAAVDALHGYLFRVLSGDAAQDLVLTIGFAGCSTFAMFQVVLGRQSIGGLFNFITYWNTIKGPIKRITGSYQKINSMLVDAERLLELLRTAPSIADDDLAKELIVSSGEVRFEDVNFAYNPGQPIIKDLSFVAAPGKTVAIVGETGGGKSTILNLLLRLYDANRGSITIDGQDVRKVTLSSLRDAFGIVPQNPILANESISWNVRYARLNATQEEIENACKAASIHDQITKFANSYETKVGEQGVQLSGGERQRIAIARVLLKNPKIVVLDEATSAVDPLTETKIQESFTRLSSGRTTFVIAHRLSTIVKADLILVMENGEIVQRGTHTELLQAGGKYAALCEQISTTLYKT